MLAKIAGICMLGGGVIMGFESITAVVGGILGFIGTTLLVAAVGVALYLGWRLLNGRSIVGRILGAVILVGGILAAFPAALAVVAGTVAAVLLAAKLAVVILLLYFGWRWFSDGEFSVPWRGGVRRGGW